MAPRAVPPAGLRRRRYAYPSLTRMSEFKIREAMSQDIAALADILSEGFATYNRWTAGGWEPPTRAAMLLGLMHKFGQDGSWCLLAFSDGEPAGQVSARPERDLAGQSRPGVARLAQLFVRERHWGSGLASELHELILQGMRERGFETACLWTAVGQARARAFYEREGWCATERLDPYNELRLELIEYELALTRARADRSARSSARSG